MNPLERLKQIRSDEGGVVLVEVLVSAILIVILAVGAFGAFDSSTRSAAEERHRAQAHAIAEADISRMRSMRISEVATLNETRTVSQQGTPYTVVSKAQFLSDATGEAPSCESGSASSDYIQITSTVTWPSINARPPVVVTSLVAPPAGSITGGTLVVSVEDSRAEGIAGVGLSGSGAGSFSGTTGPTGCAIFSNLPPGDYTLTLSGIASGLVDKDGLPPQAQETSVVAESTNTLVIQLDDPGEIPVGFNTKPYGSDSSTTPLTTQGDSVVFFNTGMTTERIFGTAGTPVSQVTGTPMFPFTSTYDVYAGLCTAHNPNPDDLLPPPFPTAIQSVTVPPGGVAPATVQLPALHLNVYSGSSTGSTRQNDAKVWIFDVDCPDVPTSGFNREYTTESVPNAGSSFPRAGRLANPGLPFSRYVVYARWQSGSTVRCNLVRTPISGTTDPIEVIELNTATGLSTGVSKNLFLQGEGAGSNFGSCPSL